jgi:hypothetical protein
VPPGSARCHPLLYVNRPDMMRYFEWIADLLNLCCSAPATCVRALQRSSKELPRRGIHWTSGRHCGWLK